MKIIIIIILFLLSIEKIVSNVWENVYSTYGTPIKIECVNSETCFILTKTLPTRIYKTTDVGKSWELLNSINNNTVEDMSCPDSINIFLAFRDGTIYKSSDAGNSFEPFKIEGINHTTNIAMYDSNIGVLHNGWYITHDGWETYQVFKIATDVITYSYSYPHFINDSILYSIASEFERGDPPKTPHKYIKTLFMKLNIKTRQYEFYHFANDILPLDMYVVNDNIIFACGSSNSISGGSCNDAIYKSTDGGKTWRRVLDLYSDKTKFQGHFYSPFGLQSIAFKDSLTGIAVGQFGKIVYTYDGGESWTYESKLPPKLGGGESKPATMLIRYAGTNPIIAAYNSSIHLLKEDNLAPSSKHKYSISGRVWEGDNGQAGIPISLDTFRVTMTDKDGYYRFGNLKEGNYQVRALNKYFDDANPTYYYKPFDYTPLEYNIALTSDTTGIDFNAEDIRNYYSLYGTVKNEGGEGIPDIEIQMNCHIYNVILHKTTTDPNGNYKFENLEERGRYTISPLTKGYDFSPAYYETPLTSNLNGMDFVMVPTSVVEETEKPESLSFFISIDKLYINTDLNTNNLSIKIYDLLGMQWLHTDLQAENNIDFLPNGVFFAVIYNKGELLKRFKIYVNK